MQNDIVLTCAVTGAGDTTGKSAHVPVTPKDIAKAAIDAAKAGASIAHIHARDPETVWVHVIQNCLKRLWIGCATVIPILLLI